MHRVVLDRDGEAAIVEATGELDAFAAPDLSRAFAELMGERQVLADFERVAFMDSTVLSLIVRATRDLTDAGASIRVVLPSGPARRIFEITALDRVLPVAESRSSALAALAA